MGVGVCGCVGAGDGSGTRARGGAACARARPTRCRPASATAPSGSAPSPPPRRPSSASTTPAASSATSTPTRPSAPETSSASARRARRRPVGIQQRPQQAFSLPQDSANSHSPARGEPAARSAESCPDDTTTTRPLPLARVRELTSRAPTAGPAIHMPGGELLPRRSHPHGLPRRHHLHRGRRAPHRLLLPSRSIKDRSQGP